MLIDNQTPFFSAENMRQEKEADITDIDMITQLPDPILQHILLFLPTAGAGLTYGIHSPYCTFPLTKVLRISKAFCLWLMILCPLFTNPKRTSHTHTYIVHSPLSLCLLYHPAALSLCCPSARCPLHYPAATPLWLHIARITSFRYFLLLLLQILLWLWTTEIETSTDPSLAMNH